MMSFKVYVINIFFISAILLAHRHVKKVHGTTLEMDGGPCGYDLRDISVFPKNHEYEEAIKVYNLAYSNLRPAFVVYPLTEADVKRALWCSYVYSQPLAVKSGGHSGGGYSTIDGTVSGGFVVNLAKMKAINVNPDSVTVQAGAKWEDVTKAMLESNPHQLVVGTVCPLVGVAESTLGGGYGYLSRKYGLVSDNVISMRMVTADGTRIVVANDKVNPDLFWALRGGGGGNFGIVTEFTYKTYTVPPAKYMQGELHFEASKSIEALATVSEINSELLREMYLGMFILSNRELIVRPVYLGDYAQALEHLKPLIRLARNTTISTYSSYYDLLQSTTNPPASQQLERGCFLKVFDLIVVLDLLSLAMPDVCEIMMFNIDGAVSDYSPHDSAFVHRDGIFEYYTWCEYNETNEDTVRLFEDQLYNLLNNDDVCAGSYVNDMDRDLMNWQEKYYGSNYAKLLEVKQRWNPLGHGGLHFQQEIGSVYNYLAQ